MSLLPTQANHLWLWVGDAIFWPFLQVGVSFVAFKLPLGFFSGFPAAYTTLKCEKTLYRKFLKISVWKNRLPDGASFFPGAFRKDRLHARDLPYLQRFEMETRRGEWAHWVVLSMTPLSFLWNPPWACAVMAGYALVSNLPCIFVQRHNRIVLNRITERTD